MRSLYESPTAFEFFQAVRLLSLAQPERELPGADADPSRETVRFRGDVSMAFPTADIRALTEPVADGPPEMTVSFFGVATPGSFGSLPMSYVELILWRGKHKDRALRDFLDLFNHRLLSHFYRAFEKHRFPLVYERSGAKAGGLFENVLLALLGFSTRGVRSRLPMPDLALLRWSGMLSRRPAAGGEIEDLIAEFFDVPAVATPFVPTWYVVEDDERLRLGRTRSRLGRDTFLGDSVLVAQSRFALRIGPVGLEKYSAFLPGGDCFLELQSLLQLAAGPEYDFEVRLRLKRGEVPVLRLGRTVALPARLGWTTWLATRPLEQDPEDVVISANRAHVRGN
jgi:type VI secretion system protein ImpH